jgi:hypothetical protein
MHEPWPLSQAPPSFTLAQVPVALSHAWHHLLHWEAHLRTIVGVANALDVVVVLILVLVDECVGGVGVADTLEEEDVGRVGVAVMILCW